MDEQFNEILEAVLKTEVDEESQLSEWIAKAKVSEKGIAALKSALRILSAYKDELPKDALDKLAAAAGYPAPLKAKGKKEDEEGGMDKKVKKEEAVSSEISPETQAIFKAQEVEINALKERNAEIQKALHEEKTRRELETWIAKAKEELAYYPGKSSQELGEQLQKMHAVDPALAANQFEMMKLASNALKESAILKERGSMGSGSLTGSAWEQITKLADGLIEKSADLKITKEKAVAKVLELRPDLYQSYLEEHPRQAAAI